MPRVRQKVTPGYDITYVETYKGAPSSTWVDGISEDAKHCSDVVTPRWRALVREGHIINNACVITHSYSQSKGDSYYRTVLDADPNEYYEGSGGSVTGAKAHSVQIHISDNPEEEINVPSGIDIAKTKAIANIDPVPYAFGEDLFEIGETIKFLRSPLQSVDDLMRAFAKKRVDIDNSIRKPAQKVLALASLWNQTRFALIPLISSAMDVLELYNERHKRKRPNPRRTARGFFQARNEMDEDVFTYDVPTYPVANSSFQQSAWRDLDVKASILYQMSNPIEGWRFDLGLRNKDILLTLWQIVPLSFMLDRLLNISDAIRGLVNLADPNLTIFAGSVRHKYNSFHSYQLVSQSVPGWTATINGDRRTWFSGTYNRQPWSPSVFEIIPTFTPEYVVKDVSSILDLIAIIISRVVH